MSKKLVGGLILALSLAWGTMAMAQPNATGCGNAATGAAWVQVLHFPFFGPSDTDTWNGFALHNTGAAIGAGSLCFVAIDAAAGSQVHLNGSLVAPLAAQQGIPANGQFVSFVDTLNADYPQFARSHHLAVFRGDLAANAQAASLATLKGYGMVGSTAGEGAQGYLALNRTLEEGPGSFDTNLPINGAGMLRFDYVPHKDAGWDSGIAIANLGAAEAQLWFHIRYQDGTGATFGGATNRVAANAIWSKWFQDINANVKTNQPAAVYVIATALGAANPFGSGIPTDTASNTPIHGYTYFTDGDQAQGLVPVYTENNT